MSKPAQDFTRLRNVCGMAHIDQALRILRRKIAAVLVDVNPLLKIFGVRFGVELGGIDILPPADHLKRAGVRRYQMNAAIRQ